ncbi:hypothetical protein Dimus_008917 [Dionaea muscipula]
MKSCSEPRRADEHETSPSASSALHHRFTEQLLDELASPILHGRASPLAASGTTPSSGPVASSGFILGVAVAGDQQADKKHASEQWKRHGRLADDAGSEPVGERHEPRRADEHENSPSASSALHHRFIEQLLEELASPILHGRASPLAASGATPSSGPVASSGFILGVAVAGDEQADKKHASEQWKRHGRLADDAGSEPVGERQ